MSWYSPSCSQSASRFGSFTGRFAFIEKPVLGRFRVDLRSTCVSIALRLSGVVLIICECCCRLGGPKEPETVTSSRESASKHPNTVLFYTARMTSEHGLPSKSCWQRGKQLGIQFAHPFP